MLIGLQMGITSGCAVYENGNIIYAASEERYSRKKNDSNYPSLSIKRAKEFCSIKSNEIEKIILVSQNMTPVHFLCNVGGYGIKEYVKEEKEYYYPTLICGEHRNYLEVFKERCEKTEYKDLYQKIINAPSTEWSNIWNQWRIETVAKDFGVSEEKVVIMNHEYSHAAYGFYGAGIQEYRDALGIVYDGFGDKSNASIYKYDGKIKQIASYKNYNIGRIYRYLTLILGMKPGEHEYKVMGLAPYATEYIYKEPLNVFRKAYRFEDGNIVIDPELKDNYYYFKERLEGMRFDGIAGALQIFTEEMNKSLVEYWLKKEKLNKCIISGGVSLNIKANMEIGKMDPVKDLFVVGSSGDESLCIGAIFAYLDEQGRGEEVCKLGTLYLGDDICKQDIDNMLEIVDTKKYDIVRDMSEKEIAQKLVDGFILGRVSGRMEFGARALGNRSIIADPSKRETVEKINRKIKSRDFWMPFTPSILAEDADLYLDNRKKFKYPFMSVACETTDIAREHLKAAIHPADFTARPQLVTKEMNKGYYELISAFKEASGVGALLNTSLNIHGYPIVRTAEDAYSVLENSDLDGLIFDGVAVFRKSSGRVFNKRKER